MDPLFDYYLCTKDGDAELWTVFAEELDAPAGYESVQKIPFWQALLWARALAEVEGDMRPGPELFPLAPFMHADEERIRQLFEDDELW